MSVKELSLKQAREKLGAKQEEMGKIFAEALVTGGSGQKEYDFNKVTCLGADVKGSIAVAEKVAQLNAEANELAEHAEKLEGAELAAKEYGDREKGRRGFSLPGGGGKGGERGQVKSLGQTVSDEKAFQKWADEGAGGGISFSYDEMWPSDMLAKGASFQTIGSKTLMTTQAGYAPEVIRMPGFVEARTRPIQLLDIIPTFRTSQAAAKYMEETTRTHGAAETAEGGDYAESAFAFTERSLPVQKITDSLPVTDEQLEDVPFMAGFIDGRLTYGVRQRMDGQCFVGDGSGSNIRGLKNVSGIQTKAKGTDPVPDVFYKGMTKVRLVGRAIPTHHLMHPNDWERIRLLRTADGIYVWGSPSESGPERLWGLPVVQEDAGDEGYGMVGAFDPAWINLLERQGVNIQIGYVGSQFTQGKRTVRGDARVVLVVYRPPAFCELTGLNL